MLHTLLRLLPRDRGLRPTVHALAIILQPAALPMYGLQEVTLDAAVIEAASTPLQFSEAHRIGAAAVSDASRRATLHAVRDVWETADGVVLLQAGIFGFWRLNSDGLVTERYSLEGDGPGAFRRTGRLGFVGDTMWITDPALRRVTYFADDTVAATVTIRAIYGRWPVVPVHVLADGSVLCATSVPHRDVADPDIVAAPLLRCSRDGTVDEPLVWRRLGRDRVRYELETGREVFTRHPVPTGTVGAIDPHGRFVLVADWQPSRPEVLTIRKIALSADTVRTLNVRLPAQPLSARARERLVAEEVERLGERVALRIVERTLAIPRFRRPFQSLLVGPDGHVWLEFSRRDGEVTRGHGYERRWLVLTPQLMFHSWITGAMEGSPLRAGASGMWMRTVDDEGVEQLIYYVAVEP